MRCGIPHNGSMDIERGQLVEVETASGERVTMRALGDRTAGVDFPIVRVCTPDDWDQGNGDDLGIPWPARNVHILPMNVHA